MALRSEGFAEVDHNTLRSVLARETLNCKEVVVFEAALGWAREECRRRGDEQPTPAQMREALGDVLRLIRIPAMSLEEYADTAAQSGILTLQETTDIFLHYTAKQKPAIELSAVPRTGLKAQVRNGQNWLCSGLVGSFMLE